MNAGKENQIEQLQAPNPQAYGDFYFTIQGNIGCGKSTFLKLLRQKFPDAKWIQEPVSDWQNVGQKNVNILEHYYKEPKRWGFTFQMYAIYTRVKKLQQACERFPTKLKISERSILADKYVFAELMKDLGYMDECQYQVYKALYKSFENLAFVQKTKIIYLRCKPQKCLQRTKIRQREQQNAIPFQYLQRIHKKHEQWFKQYNPKQVLILDTTQDFHGNESRTKQMIQKLRQFIGTD